MTRWEPNARGRLERAAMELYREHGYDQTTVAHIAERAGLTERTFFRHFADKREILFAGGGMLQEAIVSAVASAPESATPLEAAVAGMEAAGAILEEQRGRRFARERQRVIASSPELRERELHKLAAIAAGVTVALRERGVGDTAASILGEITIAVFHISFGRWVAKSKGPDLRELMRESLAELQALMSAAPPVGAQS